MIVETLSPPTRRLAALAILVLLGLLVLQLVVMPVVDLLGQSRQSLADARYRLARLQAMANAPDPPAPPEGLHQLVVIAPDREQATARLVALLNRSAGPVGVQIETGTTAAPKGANELRLPIVVRGSSDAVLRWVHMIETGKPLIRFAKAELLFDSSGMATLSGEVAAIWQSGR